MQLFERTLGQWLEHWAEETPDKEYIVYSDRNLRFTWSQLNQRVDDMAKGLIAVGVERGTHVGIWAANVPDWLTLLYACAKIGAVYVTVNTNYKHAERLDERIAGEVEDDRRHHRDGGDEDAAGQRDAMQHVLDIGHRRRARTHTGNEAALLAQVVGRLLRIEHHGGVEVREEHDEQHGEDPVDPAGGDGVGHRRQPAHVEQGRQLRREVDQAACEDDRDDARRIHLEGNVGGLAAHHLATLHALGIVHRDAALRTLHEDDRGNAGKHHKQGDHRNRDAHSGIGREVHRREDGARHARHDAHEDDERHAVADAALRDKLAHPHDERSARHEREHDEDVGEDLRHLRGEHHAVLRRLEQQQVADGIDQTQTQRQVTRDLRDLATTRLAFLSPAPDGGDDALHQLHDDRCRDVGHDAQRENREIRQRTAREQVEHGHGHARVLERVRELVERDAGHRHVRAETIQREDSQSEQDLLAQLRYLECIDDRA